jgi:hypothetical protein
MLLWVLFAIEGSLLVSVFIQIVVVALIAWLLWWLIAYMGLPQPFDKVLRVLIAIVAVIFLINAILSLAGQSFIRW